MDKSVVAKSRYGILNQIEIKINSIWAANRKIVSVQCDGETFFQSSFKKQIPDYHQRGFQIITKWFDIPRASETQTSFESQLHKNIQHKAHTI